MFHLIILLCYLIVVLYNGNKLTYTLYYTVQYVTQKKLQKKKKTFLISTNSNMLESYIRSTSTRNLLDCIHVK